MKTTLNRTASNIINFGFKSLVLTICLGLFLSSSVYAKKYRLKLVSAYPSRHPSIVHGLMPWIKSLKEKSGGRLIIQFYEPGTLTPRDQHMEAVRSGVADIAFEVTNNDYPLSEVVAMPFMFKSVEAASRTRWEMLQRFPAMAAEYKGVKLLWGHTSAFYQLHTKDIKVTSLEDIKGKRIIVWTANGRKFASMLGVSPQMIHFLDNYMALQRNMADGVFCPLAPMKSVKLDEVTHYHNIINFAQDAFWGVININSFNNLPPDLQQLLENEAGAKLAAIFGKTLDDGSREAVEYMKSKGHEFIDLPPEEMQRWKDKIKPIYEEWISDMEAKGHKNARKMFETALELGKQYQAEIDARQ